MKNLLEQGIPSKSFRLGQVLFRVKYSFNLFMPKQRKKIKIKINIKIVLVIKKR